MTHARRPVPRALLGLVSLLGRRPDGLPARIGVRLLMRASLPELVFTNEDGYRILVDCRDQMEANALMGRYRLPHHVIELVRPGDWVIDAGANVGIVSSQLSAAVGGNGLVSAWEPIERNIERLRFLKQENCLAQLSVVPHAAGDEDSIASIGLGGDHRSGWSSITASWIAEHSVEVTVRRPDAYVEPGASARTLRLIKVDVEGYEPEVLEGCRGLLETHRPWIYCEFNEVLLRDRGQSSSGLLERLAALGYRPVEPTRPFRRRAANLLLRHERAL